ncbi:P-loop containing nucleoside triphosphate hydrolase protein, partial [Amylostereum chailletii]
MSSVLGQRLSWQDACRRDWTSSEGLAELTNIVAPLLPFAPRPFQIKDSACILKGLDVFCVSATGDGKSALIYIPALVCDGITLVIEPTNFLQSSLHQYSGNLQKRGIKILVINSETRHEAEGQRRNLWKEAAEGLYQVVALSPELLRTAEFDVLVKTKSFRLKWTNLAVDESHLTDEWGGDFRPLYEDIYSVRSRGPDHLCVIALSATVEPGPQTTRIMNHIGFRPKAHYLDRRDCERLNMAIIFRDVKFSFSGFIFWDIDWVIPVGIQSSTDIPKTLLYCETIDLGHRVTTYL